MFNTRALIATLLASALTSGALAKDIEWPLFGLDTKAHRHSPAKQIDETNVAKLTLTWEYDTGIKATFQATPIVQEGVMYVSLPFNHVVALDANTGKQKWRYTHDRDKSYPMCCGPANRGVAVANGLVLMGTVDGRLIALDSKTGQKRWDTDVVKGDTGIAEDVSTLQGVTTGKVAGASGAGLNMAPIVYKDMVIIGITGVGYGLHIEEDIPDAPLGSVVGVAGKYGRKGFLAAYDIKTGKRIWKFDTVANQGWEGEYATHTPDGFKLPRDIAQEKSDAPKFSDAWQYGGGSAWSTPTIDHQTGTLFFGTGNPSPQMEGSSRPGDNLYTVSIVALNALTGQLKWSFQQVPHDMWGYDVASPTVLFDAMVAGKKVPAVGQAGKTGLFYVLNRETGALIKTSDAFVPQQNMYKPATTEGIEIYPGVVGGSNWSPVSVDEANRQVFVAGIHWPVKYQLHEIPAKGDKPAVKYSSMSPIMDIERYGILSAIDLDTGKMRWRYKTRNPLIGGVLSTEGGLVFTGAGEGKLVAHSAKNGRKLWEAETEAGVNAPPITYQIGGKQYVAVAVGGNKLFGFASGQTIKAWALPNP